MTDSVNELALRDTYRLLELEGVDICRLLKRQIDVYVTRSPYALTGVLLWQARLSEHSTGCEFDCR